MGPTYKIVGLRTIELMIFFNECFFRGLKWAKIMPNYSHIQWLAYFKIKLSSKV